MIFKMRLTIFTFCKAVIVKFYENKFAKYILFESFNEQCLEQKRG